jgi:hypothetical protein
MKACSLGAGRSWYVGNRQRFGYAQSSEQRDDRDWWASEVDKKVLQGGFLLGTHGSDLETADYDLLAISYDGLKFDYQRIGVVHRRR